MTSTPDCYSPGPHLSLHVQDDGYHVVHCTRCDGEFQATPRPVTYERQSNG